LERTITPQELPSSNQPPKLPNDVQVLTIQGRIFILVGTAHVSRESADLVREIITREHPDCVCVELDQQRFVALSQQRRWEDIDLREVIRKRQLSHLLAGVVLASYQKRLGGQLGMIPGAEMLAATTVAQEQGIPIALCDRELRVTLTRLWRYTSWWRKLLLLSTLLASLFDTKTTISEEDLRTIRQQDVLSALLDELGGTFPVLRQVLIDERDSYLAHHIRQATGERIVAVMGAAHVPGVRQALLESRQVNVQALMTIPPASSVGRWVGWGIPGVIVAAIAVSAWQYGLAAAGHNILYWVIISGLPCALGAICALAHPLTVLAAFVAAPITTLHPLLGAGYVTALVQTYLRPPVVREFHSVADDIRSPSAWWRNKLLRIFLAFLLPSLGSALGAWIGGYTIIASLFAHGR
jgi:pheromone shutdown-related protein TraB